MKGPRKLFLLAAFFVALVVRALHFTVRCHFIGFREYRKRLENGEAFLIAFWHNQGLFMPFAYFGPWGKIRLIVSQSRDGELIASLLWWFGILSVRGSSSRGGTEALRELMKYSRDRSTSLVFTPDGPKGPVYKVKEGLAYLASRSERPLYLLSVAYTRAKYFGSWDRFRLPFPFCQAFFTCSPPLRFSRTHNGDELEEVRTTIEQAMNRVNEIATALAEKAITIRESEQLLSPTVFPASPFPENTSAP
ncbi:MAG: lysophospholipid acyltransferase family protein [Leptospirales bacterium]